MGLPGPVAHVVALGAHGAAWLAGRGGAALPGDLLAPPHVRAIRFDHLYTEGQTLQHDTVATGVQAWLELLRRTGHTRLAVYRLPVNQPVDDWQTAGFVGGGGRWLLGATSAAGHDYWEARWAFDGEPGSGAWDVVYGRVIRADGRPPPVTLSLAQAESAMAEALLAARELAREVGRADDAQAFADALALLASRGEAASEVLRGTAAPARVQRLAAAAERAWVFGGMLSWNDQGHEGARQVRFEQVSRALYLSVTDALVAASHAAGVGGARGWLQRWLG